MEGLVWKIQLLSRQYHIWTAGCIRNWTVIAMLKWTQVDIFAHVWVGTWRSWLWEIMFHGRFSCNVIWYWVGKVFKVTLFGRSNQHIYFDYFQLGGWATRKKTRICCCPMWSIDFSIPLWLKLVYNIATYINNNWEHYYIIYMYIQHTWRIYIYIFMYVYIITNHI